jgi:endo-1,4-beta-mannosidase
MWQKETFDPQTIDRELGWASKIGFNIVRVFLHNLLWAQDAAGFKQRINQFLEIASKNKIKVMFVFFDDCWNGYPKLGKQPEPIPGVHNSQWVQSPGENAYQDKEKFKDLQAYVLDILSTYRADERVALWDLYNEPGNSGHLAKTLPLLQAVFFTARQALTSQPVTSGVWNYGPEFK